MPDQNQARGDPAATPAVGDHEIVPPAPPETQDPASATGAGPRSNWTAALEAVPEGAPRPPDPGRGLAAWFVILALFGGIGLAFGMEEMAALTALAGLFVAAQAADLDSRWESLHTVTSWIVPASGAAAGLIVATQIHLHYEGSASVRWLAIGLAMATSGGAVMLMFRPFTDGLVRLLMRTREASHTLRLAARVTLVSVMLSIPSWFALRTLFGDTLEDSNGLFQHASLASQLAGYVVLALASVGFLLRRDLRQTCQRLGLTSLNRSHLALIAIGVMGFYGLNAGADWVQQSFFPVLWEQDHRVNQAIVAGLGPLRTVLLGLSAGIGEEITMRGALQPKLGLLLTSLVFASLHVQYSWFGMLVVFLLGLMLGTIRIRAGTTAAIAVHIVYDVLALFSVQGP